MRGIFAALLILFAGGCTLQPPKVAPVLEPKSTAKIWPLPPDKPRYAYAGTLIGEKDFIAESEAQEKTRSIFSAIIGLLVGERRYTEIQRPISGLVDQQGRVLVVDASHQAILVFDMKGRQLLKWRRAEDERFFKSPIGIASDGKTGFYVSDSELGEVFHLDQNGEPIGQFGDKILARPTGVAVDAKRGLVYVADTGEHNIKIFDSKGLLVDVLGRRGNKNGEFNAPTHLAFWNSRLYVTDTLNFRVQIFNSTGDRKLVFGRLGLRVGSMTRPKGVAVGRDGRIYVIESFYDHLLVFNPEGDLLMPIGGTGSSEGQFYLPNGVWTDEAGRVYVADMFNGRVSVFKELTVAKK